MPEWGIQSDFQVSLRILTCLLFRISYCSADATYDHVFNFIATNSNNTMECHAFLCKKRKMVSWDKYLVSWNFKVTIYPVYQVGIKSLCLSKVIKLKTDIWPKFILSQNEGKGQAGLLTDWESYLGKAKSSIDATAT